VRKQAGLDRAGELELSAWLAQAPENAAAYRRQEAMAEVFARARTGPAASELLDRVRRRESGLRRRRATRLLVACGGLAVAAWFTLPFRSAPPAATPQAAVSPETDRVRRLPDGSVIELGRDAAIALHFDRAQRQVTLTRGTALFRVAPDPGRPFAVTAAGTRVQAIGTSFQVSVARAAVSVLVTEGRVRVDDLANGHSLLPAAPAGEVSLLRAGQSATVPLAPSPGTALARIAELSAEDVRRELAWRTNRLRFDGTDLAAAVTEINRYNRLQIALAQPDLARLRLSGEFVADEPETFARLAAQALGLGIRADPPGADLVLERR
jgi:transmembrane sensor